jgi:hypothetical protein
MIQRDVWIWKGIPENFKEFIKEVFVMWVWTSVVLGFFIGFIIAFIMGGFNV